MKRLAGRSHGVQRVHSLARRVDDGPAVEGATSQHDQRKEITDATYTGDGAGLAAGLALGFEGAWCLFESAHQFREVALESSISAHFGLDL